MIKYMYLLLAAMLLSSCEKLTEKTTVHDPYKISDDDLQNENIYKNKTRLVLLGTGNPNAEPDRMGPAVAIIVNNVAYLIDCGTGIVRRAAAAKMKGVEALGVKNLNHLFITHLHSDHTIGLPDLIFSPWVLGRDKPLEIYGPAGTKNMTDNIVDAWKEDIDVRLHGLEYANENGYRVNVHEYYEGEIYKDSNVTVTAFPVIHGAWKYSYGLRFDTPDKSIVISGDCAPSPELIKNAKGCDILVHEVYSKAGFDVRSAKWQKYHRNSHTSTIELGRIASEVKPKLLVLYHILIWGASPEEIISEIRQNYHGNVSFGNDLDVY